MKGHCRGTRTRTEGNNGEEITRHKVQVKDARYKGYHISSDMVIADRQYATNLEEWCCTCYEAVGERLCRFHGYVAS